MLVAEMFDIVARAAADYGCEVWSTPWLEGWHLQDCALQRAHASILKRCLGVQGSTSTLAVLLECGRVPLQVNWLIRCCTYWNKLLQLSKYSKLMHDTMQANIHFGLIGQHKCWSSELCKGLQFACPDTDWREHMLSCKPIQVKAVKKAAETKFLACLAEFTGDPADPDCKHRKRCVYANWMHQAPAPAKDLSPVNYLGAQCPRRWKEAAARFRLSNARIRVNTDLRQCFTERTCTRCLSIGTGVDNEHHVLFECTALDYIRTVHKHLFDGRSTVRQFMEAAYDREICIDFCKSMYDIMTKLEDARNASPKPHTG